jgi:hypothetical protein
MLKVSLMFQEISLRKGGTMVPEETIRLDADASLQPFLAEIRPEGYMNTQGILETGGEAPALQPVTGWSVPDTPEPAEWLIAGGLDPAGAGLAEGWGIPLLPSLAFGDEDDDDDVEDEEDNFDDMEDDFEDDFEDEDDDFEDDDDDDFEDEDDDDYDYDEDGDYEDDFEE